jgi:Mannose-1-phosphate guanylyltransferase
LNGFHVKTFPEKPHRKLAQRFINFGDFLWNGGMFVWKVDSLLDQINIHMPDLYNQLEKIEKRIKIKKDFINIWRKIKSESIDYGLLEKSDDIFVIKAEFEWNDLGSWSSVYNISPKTKNNNVIRGEGKIIDGSNNLIQSEGNFTAVIGVNDIVVVNTPDVTLVIPRDKVENVKELVDFLEKNNRDDLL